jgi:antitoxin component YwqK of YwqJK toxin-antitoxin module
MVKGLVNSRAARRAVGLIALALLVAIAWSLWPSGDEQRPIGPPVEVLRNALELRDDQRLYELGAKKPFNGLLVENFSEEQRKMEIEIHDGKAHGHSRGWYDNGQLEVDESFVHGVSNGRRTRWHANGKKRSEADIVDGEIQGDYLEWHENGAKAVEMTMKNGQPEGLVEAWYPDGKLKSRTRFDGGKIAEREFFPMAGQDPSPQEEPSETPGDTDESGQCQN